MVVVVRSPWAGSHNHGGWGRHFNDRHSSHDWCGPITAHGSHLLGGCDHVVTHAVLLERDEALRAEVELNTARAHRADDEVVTHTGPRHVHEVIAGDGHGRRLLIHLTDGRGAGGSLPFVVAVLGAANQVARDRA